MSIRCNPARYPEINTNPSIGACLANISFSEYMNILASTAAGCVVGFAGGKPFRRQTLAFTGGLAFITTVTLGARSSMLRLLGDVPNQADCERRGIEFVDKGVQMRTYRPALDAQ